jgi:RHS repeat-associated protein
MTDPFGGFSQRTPGGAAAPAARLGFAGEFQDPTTGVYHLRARDYTTGLGRFGSVDPLIDSLDSPAESAYSYAHNNPLTGTDPSGKMDAGACATLICYQQITQASHDRTVSRASACATQLCHDQILASDCHCTDDTFTGHPPKPAPTIPVLTITAQTKAKGGPKVAELLQQSHSADDKWIINGHLYTREQLLDQVQGLGGRDQDPQLCEAGGCMLNPSLFPEGGHPCGYRPEDAWCNYAETTGTEVGWIGLAGGAGAGRGGRGGRASSPAAADAADARTVWDSIKATQAEYPGTPVPKSFVLETEEGTKIWVHPNATEHIIERMKTATSPTAANLSAQAQLASLRAAVSRATHSRVPLDQMVNVEGWELKFSMRQGDEFPVLKHALYTG